MNIPFSNPGHSPDDPGSAYDARPMVAIRRRDRSGWWFAGGALIAAVLLFTALEARRQGSEQARGQTPGATAFAAPEAIPELVMPMERPDASASVPAAGSWPQPGDGRRQAVVPAVAPQPPTVERPAFQPQPSYSESAYQPVPQPQPIGPLYPPPVSEAPAQPNGGAGAAGSGRVMARRLANPATTVIQGTLINAVLETALDSTRPGQTRAVVTQNVYGFDGTRLLIPRGTRLYGVYEAEIAQGQKRAQIRWTRLLRPDGVSVALDSPAADPLGRAGVEGKVNNHFFQRLGNAFIGTTANIGSALATRSVSGSSPVVVAVPGATQSATQVVAPTITQIAPTLTVRQGVRLTVFVQHDLDFTSVDETP